MGAMPSLRIVLLACLATAALALPPAASARILEVGPVGEDPTPSCPNPCLAVSRTTGYQAKVGEKRGSFVIPRAGRIVAWSITLGNPGPKQRKFFNSGYGGTPSAGITILRAGERLMSRVVAQSPIQQLEDYYGQTVQFPLEQTIPVKKGYVVALTVPTWAPALAVGFGSDTSWRASRPGDRCTDTKTQTAQTRTGQLTQYRCLYKTARLAYSATLITNPKKPKKPAQKRAG
jgi:hypothetical protein